MLRDVVPSAPSFLLYVDHVEGNGTDLFRVVCERDLEGIVAKAKHRPYSCDDPTTWVKIKNSRYSRAVELFERRTVTG